MSFSLRHDPAADCIILTVEGVVTLETIREIAPHVAALSEQTGCRNILNNMQSASIRMSFMDVFKSPNTMDESGVSRQTRRALVVPGHFTESQFLETVTQNRGHNLRVFYDVAEAMRWLRGEKDNRPPENANT